MAVNKLNRGTKRFLKEDADILSDTWKLKVTTFIKRSDRSTVSNPIWENKEHTHIYRTYDSNGKELKTSNAVGGHYHEIKTFERDGEIFAECGPPIYNATYRDNNKNTRVPVDNHTHDMEFQGSDLIKHRKHNPKAQEFISNYTNFLKEQKHQEMRQGE